MPTDAEPVVSGTWTMELPTGMTATFRLNVAEDWWNLDVQPPGRPGSAVSSGGKLADSTWFAIAVAFGAMPYPFPPD